MKLQVGYPGDLLSDDSVEEMYKKLTVQRNGFYRNVVYAAKYERLTAQDALVNPQEAHRWREALKSETPLYVYQANTLGQSSRRKFAFGLI